MREYPSSVTCKYHTILRENHKVKLRTQQRILQWYLLTPDRELAQVEWE